MKSIFVYFNIARFRNTIFKKKILGYLSNQYQNKVAIMLTIIIMMILINNSVVSSLPENFHISLSSNSTLSESFGIIKTLDHGYGSVNSNLTINAQTVNKEDSALLKIEKSNTEISTSASKLYNVNNEDFFMSQSDYSIEYIYPSSTILSQFPSRQINSTNSEKIMNCNYFINSPNFTYNWVNIESYNSTAKYSFLTFVLKQNVNGVFYLEYIVDKNQLLEVSIDSESYDLSSDKYEKIWVIEQKYLDKDFLILAKEKGKDFELIFLDIKINDLIEKNFTITLNLYTKIQIKANLYWQINKIGFYKDQFIIATKKTGLVILHRLPSQVQPYTNDSLLNITNYNVDNYLINNDPVWTIKTTINNFGLFNRSLLNSLRIDIPYRNLDSEAGVYHPDLNHFDARYLQIETINNSNVVANNTSNNVNVKETKNATNLPSDNNPTPAIINNIPLININVLDIIINELTIYLIIERRGLFIINLENFQILEEFRYENPNVYKLEFYNNIFSGHKFIGVYSENPKSTSQEIFVELLIDQELNPIANKAFTSNLYTGQGKSASYDDLFTIILNTKEKKMILIRKGMLNSIPFMTHILDISNYIKFDLEKTDFISLYDSLNKKVIYSLFTLDLVIPFNITFVDEYVYCKFSQSGRFDLNFIQRSELCNDAINSDRAVSFCERYVKYSIEVVGPPSSDIQQVLTGVLITFSIILIGLIIFILIKTDGCRNIKYFKIIKTAQIRERLYYDAGQDINIEGNKQREIMTQKIRIDNQPYIKKESEDLIYDQINENLNIVQTGRSYKFIFNPEIKKIESNPQIEASIDNDNFNKKLRVGVIDKNNLKGSKEAIKEEVETDIIKQNILNFNQSIKKNIIKENEKQLPEKNEENSSQNDLINNFKSNNDKFPVLERSKSRKENVNKDLSKKSPRAISIRNYHGNESNKLNENSNILTKHVKKDEFKFSNSKNLNRLNSEEHNNNH